MNEFLNFLLHSVFIATFLILFIVSFVILRPFRMHRSRPKSTISLKISYLLYLIVFLVLAYLVLFFNGVPTETEEPGFDSGFTIYYIIVIISFIIPNLTIMLRRKFKKFREFYNVFFASLNILITLALLYIMYIVPWGVISG
jgi:hypothetical protein